MSASQKKRNRIKKRNAVTVESTGIAIEVNRRPQASSSTPAPTQTRSPEVPADQMKLKTIGMDQNNLWLYPEVFKGLVRSLVNAFPTDVDGIRAVATTPRSVLGALTDPSTDIILMIDLKARRFMSDIKTFLATGGSLIVCGNTAGHSSPPDINTFWTDLNLPWRMGSYHRTTFALNRQCFVANDEMRRELPKSFSVKAFQLANVPPPQCLYLPTADSRVQSHVFSPTRVDQEQTPVACARTGNGGYVAWFGDVNGEEETDAVIVSLVKWIRRQQ
jgi:hypothetical protein